MRAVVLMHIGGELNGTLIDSIEYWLYANSIGHKVYLSTNLSPGFVEEILASRYIVIPQDVTSLIVGLKNNFARMLMFGSTFMKAGHMFDLERIRCIHSSSSWVQVPDHESFFHDYEKRIFLSNLRCVQSRACKYIHRSSFPLLESTKSIEYILRSEDEMLVYTTPADAEIARQIFSSKKNVKIVAGGVIPDFFDSFDELLYIYEGADFSPRLFIEAAYLGKKISYIGDVVRDDRSFVRFQHALDQELSRYALSETDRAIAWLIS